MNMLMRRKEEKMKEYRRVNKDEPKLFDKFLNSKLKKSESVIKMKDDEQPSITWWGETDQWSVKQKNNGNKINKKVFHNEFEFDPKMRREKKLENGKTKMWVEMDY